MSHQKKVTIYSMPTCSYCQLAKAYFRHHKIPYTDIDVSTNEAAAEEMVKKSGQMSTPVIEIDGSCIIGFNKSALESLL